MKPNRTPIEAFFYIIGCKDGLKDALMHQLNYYDITGIQLPTGACGIKKRLKKKKEKNKEVAKRWQMKNYRYCNTTFSKQCNKNVARPSHQFSFHFHINSSEISHIIWCSHFRTSEIRIQNICSCVIILAAAI